MTSIYLDPPDTRRAALRDLPGIYGTELETCERLVDMGFTHSHGVSLDERMRWLDRKIESIKAE